MKITLSLALIFLSLSTLAQPACKMTCPQGEVLVKKNHKNTPNQFTLFCSKKTPGKAPSIDLEYFKQSSMECLRYEKKNLLKTKIEIKKNFERITHYTINDSPMGLKSYLSDDWVREQKDNLSIIYRSYRERHDNPLSSMTSWIRWSDGAVTSEFSISKNILHCDIEKNELVTRYLQTKNFKNRFIDDYNKLFPTTLSDYALIPFDEDYYYEKKELNIKVAPAYSNVTLPGKYDRSKNIFTADEKVANYLILPSISYSFSDESNFEFSDKGEKRSRFLLTADESPNDSMSESSYQYCKYGTDCLFYPGIKMDLSIDKIQGKSPIEFCKELTAMGQKELNKIINHNK